jgi:subtilisin-like proprotein convertase family protein
MFVRKLGLVAVAALALGLVLAAPAAQARKKVITKTFQVGVGAPSGGLPLNIPDGGGAAVQLVRDPVKVAKLNPKGKLKHVTVGVRVTHPFVSDVEIYLATPRGVINLAHDVGGNGNNYGNGFGGCSGGLTTFDSNSPTLISTPGLQAPFVGTYAPQENLNQLNGLGGKKATNTLWSLLVMDDNNQHGTGTVDCFRLTIKETNPKQ